LLDSRVYITLINSTFVKYRAITSSSTVLFRVCYGEESTVAQEPESKSKNTKDVTVISPCYVLTNLVLLYLKILSPSILWVHLSPGFSTPSINFQSPSGHLGKRSSHTHAFLPRHGKHHRPSSHKSIEHAWPPRHAILI
jgi:hypothetical protein